MADLPVRRGSGASSLGRWTRGFDPFERMRELMGFDPFEQMGRMVSGGEQTWNFVPAFEVKETKDAYIFKADLPGVKESDLDITLTGDRITISGKRETEQQDESDRFYAYERSYGSFSRSFTLPEGVDVNQVNAELKEGVLNLRLPKLPEVQPKRIQVGTSETGKQGKVKA
ncbi:Hsp20/alpha crystallin family protein [Vitiosangium sp. GDMCC 1.1324]|uniref:Hsp20/alpha crystallin family protein n=1 Tax=Vitiosangium sp. (strain GDMCC 1.1324) TaxID=2138576 RepID=UPI000D3411D5|nr:HSP20 family small heat-shock protein [Vitiosangium sp. GDMCC 1.1324]PTL76303.1 spore coat protein [Vitiosangium sp. GDMCC 1.1324]